jgi:hypothetical protein
MSRTYHHGKDRRIRVRGVRRPTDLRRLARVLIDLEQARAEAEAQAETEHKVATSGKSATRTPRPKSDGSKARP